MARIRPGGSDLAAGTGVAGASKQSGEPAPPEIRAAVEKIAATDAFARSKRRAALLRYLAAEAIAGRAASLKEYTIGVEACGKRASYDPRYDPIVRVEISRLRQQLQKYYRTDGAQDPVWLELPVGCYNLRFVSREAAPARQSGRRWWAAAAVVAVAALAVIGWARYAGHSGGETLLYESGFEPPEYSIGELRFANGWQVSPQKAWSAVTVQSATVSSGRQAIRIAAAGQPNFTRAVRRIGFNSKASAAKSVSISVDAQISNDGTPTQWELITAFDDVQNFIALLGVKTSGELFVRQYGGSSLDTHVFLHRGVWNHVAMDINFRTNILMAYLNGEKIVSGFGVLTPLVGSLGQVGFEIGTADVGTDTAYFDNFSVRAIR